MAGRPRSSPGRIAAGPRKRLRGQHPDAGARLRHRRAQADDRPCAADWARPSHQRPERSKDDDRPDGTLRRGPCARSGADWRPRQPRRERRPCIAGRLEMVDPMSTLRVATYSRHEGADPSPDCAPQRSRLPGARVGDSARWTSSAAPHRRDLPHYEGLLATPEIRGADRWVPDGPAVPFERSASRSTSSRWDRFRRALIAFMEDYDVIVTPAAELPRSLTAQKRAASPTRLRTA